MSTNVSLDRDGKWQTISEGGKQWTRADAESGALARQGGAAHPSMKELLLMVDDLEQEQWEIGRHEDGDWYEAKGREKAKQIREALAEKIGRLASAAMVGEAAQADGWDAKLWRLAAEMAASHGHHSFSLRCLAIAEAIGGKA